MSYCNVSRFLGVYIDDRLTFQDHVDFICRKLSSGIFVIRTLSKIADNRVTLVAYYGLIYPFLSYAVAVWGHESQRTKFIFKLQKRAVRAIFRKPNRTSCRPLFKKHNILTFPSIYIFNCLIFLRKHFNIFQRNNTVSTHYNLRQTNNLKIPHYRTSFLERHLFISGIHLFNALPTSLKTESSVVSFEKKLKTFLLISCPYSVQEFLNI